MPRQKLALAEAGLGNCARAVELLEAALFEAQTVGNPVTLGTLHRDRAYVAALVGDLASFEHHEKRMREQFESTRNPWLARQVAALRGQAVRAGVPSVVPAPGAAGPDLDGCTELDPVTDAAFATALAKRAPSV
jgi:hypothetical protein